MKDEIAITLNAAEVSAVLGLLYTYFRSPEFGTLTSDEQEMLSVLEEKFVDAENEIYDGVTLQVDRVFKRLYNSNMKNLKGNEMKETVFTVLAEDGEIGALVEMTRSEMIEYLAHVEARYSNAPWGEIVEMFEKCDDEELLEIFEGVQ